MSRQRSGLGGPGGKRKRNGRQAGIGTRVKSCRCVSQEIGVTVAERKIGVGDDVGEWRDAGPVVLVRASRRRGSTRGEVVEHKRHRGIRMAAGGLEQPGEQQDRHKGDYCSTWVICVVNIRGGIWPSRRRDDSSAPCC